mgnify:CR=1 FL=1
MPEIADYTLNFSLSPRRKSGVGESCNRLVLKGESMLRLANKNIGARLAAQHVEGLAANLQTAVAGFRV